MTETDASLSHLMVIDMDWITKESFVLRKKNYSFDNHYEEVHTKVEMNAKLSSSGLLLLKTT